MLISRDKITSSAFRSLICDLFWGVREGRGDPKGGGPEARPSKNLGFLKFWGCAEVFPSRGEGTSFVDVFLFFWGGGGVNEFGSASRCPGRE